MTTTTQRTSRSNGSGSETSGLPGRSNRSIASSPKRGVRLPELAVGVLVTVLFALGAVLWHLSATAKEPALAVRSHLQRGDVIDYSDLRTVYVATDDALVRMTHASDVVGRVAEVDLGPGVIITPTVISDGAPIQPGEGVVGLALDPGHYPSLGLAPGDRVNVVRTSDESLSGTDTDNRVVARGATVFEVEDLASDRKLVSIKASEGEAEAVAAASGASGLKLVLVTP